MGWIKRLDRWRARFVDDASFGFMNALQWHHPLPENFRNEWLNYARQWTEASIEKYYQIPVTFSLPTWPRENQLRFSTPLPSEFSQNNVATFDLFPCAKGWGAPTMMIAHGLMSVRDVGYRHWAKKLNARGWNAVFIHLPYHYSRRLPHHLTGEFAINAHLIRSIEGIRQAVVEIRVLMNLLEAQGSPLIGGWGTSYGGWILALLACVDFRLQRLALVEPIINVHEAIWKSPAAFTMRTALRRCGITPEHTAGHLRLCCPTKLQPLLSTKNIILMAGEYDQIAIPEQIQALHAAWPGSHYFCHRQGHVGYTLMPESFRLMQIHWANDFF